MLKSLRDRGFPFDIKISLLTKCRSQAVERNLKVAVGLKQLIESITSYTQPQDFRLAVDELVNDVRLGFTKQSDADAIPVRSMPPRSPPLSVPQAPFVVCSPIDYSTTGSTCQPFY
ncbi:hypothetical protein [Photobacterium sp. OFAV2-7]|uniref:hypothetical protein n=1 Tax=Photobacterium sp. OFAV2-7 TaxID=2917748 RepID=UPI001EF5CDF2|nr:hypothetical protein [Photobacterium sp. OFAV2-7]MCG7586755.1 hypothetical protein [Photobacterium sp. OFAV2-7]